MLLETIITPKMSDSFGCYRHRWVKHNIWRYTHDGDEGDGSDDNDDKDDKDDGDDDDEEEDG